MPNPRKSPQPEGGRTFMDLEEYRRVYMHMEGVTNTPVNAFRRLFRFGKSVTNVPKALSRDEKIQQERAERRRDAKQNIRENGVSAKAVKDLVQNTPGYSKNTKNAVKNVGKSAEDVAKSVNELGQSSRAIVGTNNVNPYGGEDLEKGVSFVLTARSLLGKGLRLPESMAKTALSVGQFTVAAGKYAGENIKAEKEIRREKAKEKEEEPER